MAGRKDAGGLGRANFRTLAASTQQQPHARRAERQRQQQQHRLPLKKVLEKFVVEVKLLEGLLLEDVVYLFE